MSVPIRSVWSALLSILAAGAAACAHVQPPPGGPPDEMPPGILATDPEDGDIVPGFRDAVTFTFDERISEQGIQDAILVSPRTSPVVIDRGRSQIRVSLREGWQPDQIYHVTLLPDIRDLFDNRLLSPQEIVFSTGPAIPETNVTGSVIDRISGRPEVGARVEAIRMADSLVYAVVTDSLGEFSLARFPTGEYQIRAFVDLNRNRSLELYEARDSAFVEVTESTMPTLALRLLEPDSTAPVPGQARFAGGGITIDFDDYLDPEQGFEAANVTVTGPDGSEVEVVTVRIGAAEIFSALPDTTAGVVPTEPQPTPSVPAPESPRPVNVLTIEFDEAEEVIPGGEYTIRIQGLQNVHGLAADIEVTATAPGDAGAGVALVSRSLPDRYIPRRVAATGPGT